MSSGQTYPHAPFVVNIDIVIIIVVFLFPTLAYFEMNLQITDFHFPSG